MKLKKLFCIICALALLATLTAGCGKEEAAPFSDVWDPTWADLSMAPNIVIEPEEPPFNLGGWMYDDVVFFDVYVPYDDEYTITLEYSRPGDTGVAYGGLYLDQEDSEYSEKIPLEFAPTSKKFNDWSKYKELSCTAELSAGAVVLAIAVDELPEDFDHFINLRQITITGTIPYDEDTALFPEDIWDQEPNEDDNSGLSKDGRGDEPYGEDADLSGFEGWWIMSEEYATAFTPVSGEFYVDPLAEEWFNCDEDGNPMDYYDCWFPDESTIVLDMEEEGTLEVTLIDGMLYLYPEEPPVFLPIDGPGAAPRVDYTGTWYFMGDPDLDNYYELDGSHSSYYWDGSLNAESDYYVDTQQISYFSGPVAQPIQAILMTDGSPTLYPDPTGQVFIEDHYARNNIFVREGAQLTEEYVHTLDLLTNSSLRCYSESGESYIELTFGTGYTFQISTFFFNFDEGYFEQDPEYGEVTGTWNFDADLLLEMTYDDGSSEYSDLSNWNGELYVNAVEKDFICDFYTPA